MATPSKIMGFFYVYVLLSRKDGKLYVGSTKDLKNRLDRHNKGQVKSTKRRLPLKLIFFEAYLNKFDAIRREDYFKTTKGKRTLKQLLKEWLHVAENLK